MKTMVLPLSRVDAQQLLLHHLARHRVQRGERFIHQQHLGVGRQDARQRHALLHAARQFRRIVFLEAGQLHHLDEAAAPDARRSARVTPRIFRPNSTLPRTVFQGNSA